MIFTEHVTWYFSVVLPEPWSKSGSLLFHFTEKRKKDHLGGLHTSHLSQNSHRAMAPLVLQHNCKSWALWQHIFWRFTYMGITSKQQCLHSIIASHSYYKRRMRHDIKRFLCFNSLSFPPLLVDRQALLMTHIFRHLKSTPEAWKGIFPRRLIIPFVDVLSANVGLREQNNTTTKMLWRGCDWMSCFRSR